MSNPSKHPERRRYSRISKHFVLTYYNRLAPEEKFAASQLKNIGLGGMCLITAKPFDPQTRLAIELKTPFLTELIHLEGVVLESKEKIKNIIYETRMEFLDLSEEAKFVLNKIIEHYEREESRGYE